MRVPVLAFSILCLALGGCSAIDDFNQFHFVDDGGAAAGQDMTPALPGFGEACVNQCASSDLSCVHMAGNLTLPGGICTRACNPTLGVVACNDLPNAFCVQVDNNMALCLPRCDLGMGRDCRAGYDCCFNGKPATMGVCAPPDTNNVCH